MSLVRDHGSAEARIAFLMALRAKGLRDTAVLRAFETVPRGRFVPRRFADLALPDVALPIACGQSTLAPSLMAEMITALDVRPEHRILEIGTGTGYGSALLARLGADVVSVERYRSLALEASTRLDAQEVANVRVVHADGWHGHAAGAPYDRILVDASVEGLPAALADQLGPNGRVVLVERDEGGSVMVRYQRDALQDWTRDVLRPFSSPPLMAGVAAAL